jgi:dTDP-4-amino-4,6-dideoxygalactose transaminase
LEAINRGHISGNGAFTVKCQEFFQKTLGVQKALLTTSCTHALEMAGLLLDVRPGDEVIVPSFTFVSTVNAFVLRGARPIFADVRSDTLNLDESRLEELLSPRTKALVPVHYAGVGCEMDTIVSIARNRGVAVVEDNAHGLFGKYKKRPLGTFGCLATQSFHETKNISCGEGGALLINDPAYLDRAEIIWEKGTNRGQFFRGQVDKYTWVDVGSSYLPSEVLAAFLYAQLEHWGDIQVKRRRIWEMYQKELQSWATSEDVRPPAVPPHCEPSHHLFYLLMPTEDDRNGLIEHLKGRGILGVFHYQPLHLAPMGQRFGGKRGDCPVAEDVSARLIRLPFFNDLGYDDQTLVIEAVRDYRCR